MGKRNKKIDYKQMFEKELKDVTHNDDEVPDIYVGFKLGELHNQITRFRLEIMDFDDDIF